MKSLLGLLVFVGFNVFAQPCVDPSLIDSLAICPMVYNPVCGCDGVTYANDCIATTSGGVTSWTPGPCEPVELDSCMEIPPGIDFGACAMALGVIRQNDSCFAVSGCSMIGSNGVDYSAYLYNSLYACNSLCMNDTLVTLLCIDSNLINLNVLCPGVIDPVCGCDSVTYQNACIAMNYYGISSYQPGECVGVGVSELDFRKLVLFPNPSRDKIYLNGKQLSMIKKYQIYALDGRKIVEADFAAAIDISILNPGKYILHLNLISGQVVIESIIRE